MIYTKEQKRDIAEQLRHWGSYEGKCKLINKYVCGVLGVEGRDALNMLADLIEPEPERTCSINADWCNGKLEHCVYRCSACGAVMLDDACYFDGSSDLDWFHYCPNCGAKVTEVGQ